MDITQLVQLALAVFTALVGWPALLAVIITALQFFGWLKVENTDTFNFWANVIVFGGILILAIAGKIDIVNQIDLTFGRIAQLVSYLLILLGVPIGFNRARWENQQILASAYFSKRIK